uniref:Uncharacterized protein n=1 Tax=Mycena chlorophos TaxID=658473 RepID=A0ABQ0KXI5_MYCCL|nr:predicted protein [Mycena chlorophos]
MPPTRVPYQAVDPSLTADIHIHIPCQEHVVLVAALASHSLFSPSTHARQPLYAGIRRRQKRGRGDEATTAVEKMSTCRREYDDGTTTSAATTPRWSSPSSVVGVSLDDGSFPSSITNDARVVVAMPLCISHHRPHWSRGKIATG